MTEGRAPVERRRGLNRLFGIVATLLLAGCQAVVPRGPAPQPAPPPVVEPARPAQGNLPQDQARNRVALLVPITGPNAAVGQSIANAASLAVLDTGGKRVRITTYDTGPGAAQAAQRALADGNMLFLGPLLAEDVRAVAPTARAAGVPVITFSNDPAVAGGGVYELGFSRVQAIERVVRYAAAKGMRRFAALVPAGVYGRSAATALLHAAEASGATVSHIETYDRSPKSLASAAAKLGADHDAVLIADVGRIALQAAPLLHKGRTQLLGTELWNAEPSLAASPALAGAWFASVPDAMYRQLAQKYRTRFGKGPFRLSSLGYDAVLLTVRIAADWRPGDPFPARALADKGGFSGVDGAFRFRSDGIAERTLAVQQLGPGGFTVIAPAPRGFDGE